MNSPRTLERRTLRYPLNMPVSVKLGNDEIHARSENISLGGILLSTEFVIPEGSAVELAVGVSRLPDQELLLTAKGKVLRLQLKASGNFAVAIECDNSFELIRARSQQNMPSAGVR